MGPWRSYSVYGTIHIPVNAFQEHPRPTHPHLPLLATETQTCSHLVAPAMSALFYSVWAAVLWRTLSHRHRHSLSAPFLLQPTVLGPSQMVRAGGCSGRITPDPGPAPPDDGCKLGALSVEVISLVSKQYPSPVSTNQLTMMQWTVPAAVAVVMWGSN